MDREQLRSSPELGVVAADGDRLRHVEGVLENELHVVGGAQAGKEQVFRGDGSAQHAGDALSLGALGNARDPVDALRRRRFRHQVLTSGSKVRYDWHPALPCNVQQYMMSFRTRLLQRSAQLYKH